MVGETVSHYRIIAEIGAGGMGVVYKAEDLRLGRLVALKFLPPQLVRDADAKRRFFQEARTASAIDHVNVCTIHDIEETTDGRVFLSMAYCDGETLKKRLERGPLAATEAVRVALQVARGLARAHQAGIVHRDVKPGNIMVTTEGEAKLLDFGIAKITERRRSDADGHHPRHHRLHGARTCSWRRCRRAERRVGARRRALRDARRPPTVFGRGRLRAPAGDCRSAAVAADGRRWCDRRHRARRRSSARQGPRRPVCERRGVRARARVVRAGNGSRIRRSRPDPRPALAQPMGDRRPRGRRRRGCGGRCPVGVALERDALGAQRGAA